MSSHVYPYVFSFKSLKKGIQTRVILLDTTKSRKKDWVIRAKDNWDGEWSTVVNCTERFAQFMALTQEEKKDFPTANGGVYTESREAVGGKPGYSWGTFYWNTMRWALVEAIRGTHIHVMEDEICQLPDRYTDALKAIPAPDEVEGKPQLGSISDSNEPLRWKYDGLDYSYDYLGRLEYALQRLQFKIVCNF